MTTTRALYKLDEMLKVIKTLLETGEQLRAAQALEVKALVDAAVKAAAISDHPLNRNEDLREALKPFTGGINDNMEL